MRSSVLLVAGGTNGQTSYRRRLIGGAPDPSITALFVLAPRGSRSQCKAFGWLAYCLPLRVPGIAPLPSPRPPGRLLCVLRRSRRDRGMQKEAHLRHDGTSHAMGRTRIRKKATQASCRGGIRPGLGVRRRELGGLAGTQRSPTATIYEISLAVSATSHDPDSAVAAKLSSLTRSRENLSKGIHSFESFDADDESELE